MSASEEHIMEKHSANTLFKWEGKGMGLGKREERVEITREVENERKRLRKGEMNVGLGYQGDQDTGKEKGEEARGADMQAGVGRKGAGGTERRQASTRASVGACTGLDGTAISDGLQEPPPQPYPWGSRG